MLTTPSSENWRAWPVEAKLKMLQRLQERPTPAKPTTQALKTPDPVAFVRDVLHAHPTDYQAEILNNLVTYKREAVRGPHGLGKTTVAAWAVLWFISTFDDAKVPTTASAWRQLTKFLWPEIHKWAGKAHLPWDVLSLSIKRGPSCEAFAVASDNPDLIEGAHADHLLYVFDESKAIPDETWDAAEGAFASGDCYALAISTPGDRAGRFYDIHRHAPGYENWHTRHVTLEEAIAAGRVSKAWADDAEKQWGKDSPVYQARVLGEFPIQVSDALISLAWIEAARERELKPEGEAKCGVDIARFGDDNSVMTDVQGPCVMACQRWQGNDTMESAGRIKSHELYANIDVIGVGAGVFDRLNEQGFGCNGVNVGEAASDPEHFKNLRSELAWALRERFQEGRIDLSRMDRESYDRLTGELTALKFKYTSSGQLQLEAKEDMKKRLGHSPDYADSLMIAYADRGPLVLFEA